MNTTHERGARIVLAGCIVQVASSVCYGQLFMIEQLAPRTQLDVPAISGNGQVVVGTSVAGAQPVAFSWTRASGRQDWLPVGQFNSQAMGVSPEGRFVVGVAASTPTAYSAYRRDLANGQVLPLGNVPAFTSSVGAAVSSNGAVVVGRSIRGTGSGNTALDVSVAVRWDSAGVPTPLGYLHTTGRYSDARAVTPDGTTIVGVSNTIGGSEAYRWTAATGMVGLEMPARSVFAYANAVSTDGRYVAGEAERAQAGSTDVGPVRWNEQGQWEYLGLPVGCTSGNAFGISGDGRLIVGFAFDPQSLTGRGGAFVWREGEGSMQLGTYLRQSGIDIPSNLYLSNCTGVSADGQVFCGKVFDTVTRINRGFVAIIPAPGSLAVLGLAGLAATRRRRIG